MSINYMACNGTVFKANEDNLSGGVNVYSTWDAQPWHIAIDFAEFGAWHRSEIWEGLKSFAGYDAVRYSYKGAVDSASK